MPFKVRASLILSKLPGCSAFVVVGFLIGCYREWPGITCMLNVLNSIVALHMGISEGRSCIGLAGRNMRNCVELQGGHAPCVR